MSYVSWEFHKQGVCPCGQVFVGPRTQKRCADCGKKRKQHTMRLWRRAKVSRAVSTAEGAGLDGAV